MIIMDLLYTLAEWQSYAKLRLHTESTLNEFTGICSQLGKLVCKFLKTTCQKYVTKELPNEISARGRRAALLAAKGITPKQTYTGESKIVKLNIATYKGHSLPDYPMTVRALGTTDNFTTQVVSHFD